MATLSVNVSVPTEVRIALEGQIGATRLLLLSVGALVVLTLVLERFFRVNRLKDEPPEAPAAIPIPYIGHMIGLLRHKMDYYVRLRYS